MGDVKYFPLHVSVCVPGAPYLVCCAEISKAVMFVIHSLLHGTLSLFRSVFIQ